MFCIQAIINLLFWKEDRYKFTLTECMCVMVAVQNRQIAAVTRTIHPVSD